MDYATSPRGDLVRLIYKQQEQIEILKGIVSELQEKLQQKETGDDNSSKLPGFIKANKKKKHTTERKKREYGFARKKETPTDTVFHSCTICSLCGSSDLGKPTVLYERQIIDIPHTTYTVTAHVVFKRACNGCKNTSSPHVDFSPYVLGKGRIGITLMAAIFTMREEADMTVSQIQNHLFSFYGLSLSVGEIIEILHQEAELATPLYTTMKDKLLTEKVIYADETGGREDGVNGYHWSFSNQKYQVLLYRRSRGAKVVEEVFGKEGERYNGVLVTDFYSAYNTYLGPHQRCWVHFLRDIKKLKEMHPKDKSLKQWERRMQMVYEEAKSYPGPSAHVPPGLTEEERMGKEHYFKQKLKNLCEPYMKTNTPQAKLAGRALRFLHEMFTFVRFEGVLPDNNMAERAVRKTVIKRKISFGTRSPKGSQTQAILASLFGTWRLQQLNPFEQMRLLLLNASQQV